MTLKQKLALLSIILCAIFFRYFKLFSVEWTWQDKSLPRIEIQADIPGGLFPDEAANGLDIISMEQGQLQPFYERGNGREALFFYIIWAVVKIFGFGVWQHHVVSAGVGVLAVLGTFLATRALFTKFPTSGLFSKSNFFNPTNLALVSAFLMASSSWHAVVSRTAFRANMIPLFTSFSVYFLIKTLDADGRKKILFASLFGTVFALGFYTYIAYRIFAPILVFALLWLTVSRLFALKNKILTIKKWLPSIASFIIFTSLTLTPLVHYFWTHPGSFVGRSGQVSIFNPELNQGKLMATFIEVSKVSFLGYFTEGDLNWRHNISGKAFLPQVVSPFFALGLIVALVKACGYLILPVRFKNFWPEFLLMGWFWGMLVPVVTTAEGIPHGLRAIGTIPSVFIISALGIWNAGEILRKALSLIKLKPIEETKYRHWGVKIVAGGYFFFILFSTYNAYFVRAYNDPSNFFAFRSDLTVVSEYLKTYGRKERTFLVLDKFSVQTPDYLTVIDPKNLESNPKNRPYVQIDPEESYRLKDIVKVLPGSQVVFTQSSIFDIKKFKENNPEFKLVREERNKFNQAVLAVYEN